jgi:hypothetical protein
MEKFIPFKKRSKKKQQEANLERRKSWGNISPVTRRPPNPKAYNRKKAQKWNNDSSSVPFVLWSLFYQQLNTTFSSSYRCPHQ